MTMNFVGLDSVCKYCSRRSGTLYYPSEGGGPYCSDCCPISAKNSVDQSIAIKPLSIFDPVNHPKHYKSHPSGIECIEVTRHMNFNRGNAVKYIWRAGDKGNEIEDLKKAIWYLNDEVARLEKNGKPS